MRTYLVGRSTVALAFICLLLTPGLRAGIDPLPTSMSNADFWKLTEELSEPEGTFQSDNLLSNEMSLSTVAARLAGQVKPGGVYLGVGPEQNFTYIAAMRPKIAFITDIRRGNLRLHLIYKALFELSATRADFVSKLLTKPRPPGLTTASTAADLMNAYWNVETSPESVYHANLQAIHDHLTKTRRLPLPPDDLAGIATIYHAFYWYGPSINYGSTRTGQTGGRSTYADLMMTTDSVSGAEWSYLATEDRFQVVKDLHAKNLIVPVVGDFAGPKALRAVGAWIRVREATVSAFYVSNVESYLTRNGVWTTFCGNVAQMPLDEHSVFIRPSLFGGATVLSAVRLGADGRVLGPPTTIATQTPTPSSSRGTPFGAIAYEVALCR
jgi:hypothetical protein